MCSDYNQTKLRAKLDMQALGIRIAENFARPQQAVCFCCSQVSLLLGIET